MKYLILLLFALLFVNTLSAQERLGKSASEIKSEFNDKKYELSDGYTTEDKIYWIFYKQTTYNVLHYFNEKKICTATCIYPNDARVLNKFMTSYNENYTKVSSKEWKLDRNGKTISISLVNGEQETFFVWGYK